MDNLLTLFDLPPAPPVARLQSRRPALRLGCVHEDVVKKRLRRVLIDDRVWFGNHYADRVSESTYLVYWRNGAYSHELTGFKALVGFVQRYIVSIDNVRIEEYGAWVDDDALALAA